MGGILSTALGLLGQGPINTTYAFRDLSGSFNNPALAAAIPIVGGDIGNGTLTIEMTTERTSHLVGADGVVMPSYKAGDNGRVTIEMQQTSALHHSLLALFNVLKTAADGGDVSNWASSSMSFRTTLDGSIHICKGVSFEKVPNKPYAADGQNLTWVLWCAQIINQ